MSMSCARGLEDLLRQLHKVLGLTKAKLRERAGICARGVNDLKRSAPSLRAVTPSVSAL